MGIKEEALLTAVKAWCIFYKTTASEAIDILEGMRPQAKAEPNKELFYRLVEALQQPKTVKYTSQRATKLRQRRKTWSDNDLIKAAKIVAGDPFLMGDNPSGKRYGNIDYLLRNDEKVDNWLAEGGNSTEHSDLSRLEF